MAENGNAATEGGEPQGQPDEGAQKGPQGTDWKAEAKKWEKRAKADHDKAKAYDDLQEQSKSDLQKAQDKAARAEKELKELKARAERDSVRAKVAEETGIPSKLIVGDDEDEMREFAAAVAKFAKPDTAPRARKPGKFASDAGGDKDAAKRELARQMFGAGN